MITRGHTVRLGLPGLALVIALSGCASGDTDAPADAGAPPVVTIHGTDFAFDGPTEIPAGMTEIVLQNDGQEIHQIQLIKLDDGKTVEDFGAAMGAGEAALPEWATAVGGPNAAMPGQSANAFVELEPGAYVMSCIIPSLSDGVLHSEKGMVGGFTVTETGASTAAAPEPDVVVAGTDFAFELPSDLSAGEHVFEFENNGAQDHELTLIKLEGDATVEEFASYFGPDAPAGIPPGVGAGGVVALAPGMSQTFEASLDAGRYAFVCFLPDPASGAPHFALGMQREVTVP